MSFTQTLNTIMVRLIKLKYAIKIYLTTSDVTYNPNKHKNKLRRNRYFKEKTPNLKCNAENSGNVNLSFFPVNFTFFFTSKNGILP